MTLVDGKKSIDPIINLHEDIETKVRRYFSGGTNNTTQESLTESRDESDSAIKSLIESTNAILKTFEKKWLATFEERSIEGVDIETSTEWIQKELAILGMDVEIRIQYKTVGNTSFKCGEIELKSKMS